MDTWIEVKNNKPVVGEFVLLLLEGETMLKGRFNNNGWSAFFADGERLVRDREVTHWMMLPTLPGAEQKQQPKLSREKIAAMAMQGLITGKWACPDNTNASPDVIAPLAVAHADALLEQLSKTQP